MENNEFKNVPIKNRMSFLMTQLEDFDFNILIENKSHENILIYDISYNTVIGPKPLQIRFDEIDGFIRIWDGTRYLALFDPEKYGICNSIR